MENLRIFDTFQDYIDYKESPDFKMPSANAVHNTQEGYDLMFIDNGINHNTISYVMSEESDFDTVFGSNITTIFGENLLIKTDYKGIKYFVLDSPLHNFINSTDDTFAFTDIMSITLPDTIKEISDDTFTECVYLNQVILPKYLEKIRTFAFYNCGSLQEIIIPKYVNLIEAYAVDGCGLRTLEFESKHLENLLIAKDAFYSLPYLNTIITRSKLPFNKLIPIPNTFTDCGRYATNKRFYLPFNFDEEAYKHIFTPTNLGAYKISHKVSNVSGNIICNIDSMPLNAIASNIAAVSNTSTQIQLAVTYGGDSFYDVLGEEYIDTTKSCFLQIPIDKNKTPDTIYHTVSFSRNIFNVDTGTDIGVSDSVNIEQWGRPQVRIEYNDDTTGWHMHRDNSVIGHNPNTGETWEMWHTVFRNRNMTMGSTSSKMRVYFKNILNPKFYIDNYAESKFDYIQVSALDKEMSEEIYITGSGIQYPLFYFRRPVEFNVSDSEEHFVEIEFKKDSSVNTNADAGYVSFYDNDNGGWLENNFIINKKPSYPGLTNIYRTRVINSYYNGITNINNIKDAYTHGLQSGTNPLNSNVPVYKYNSYTLQLERVSKEYSYKYGTYAWYLFTFNVINAKSGMTNNPDKNYIPYHKSGTTASSQTTKITTNSAIRVRGFYNNNSIYFDIKRNGFEVLENRTNTNAVWNSAGTDFPSWYLAINDCSTVAKLQGTHKVNVSPYSTLTYSTIGTAYNGTTTTFVCANYDWVECDANATKITPQDVIPDANFGKLYMSGNAGKNDSISLMTIDIVGYEDFVMYARSSGKSNYHYLSISKPNVSIEDFMTDVCQRASGYTPTKYTYKTFKGKSTSTSVTTSLYESEKSFEKVEFDISGLLYDTATCQIICAFVKDKNAPDEHDAGFIYIPN